MNNPWIGGLKLCSQAPFKSSSEKEGKDFGREVLCVVFFFVCVCVCVC